MASHATHLHQPRSGGTGKPGTVVPGRRDKLPESALADGTSLLLFVGESWRSYSIHRKIPDSCFCWGGARLDIRPLDKHYEMFGRGELTACGALSQLNAYTDLGCGQAPFTARLLVFTAFPAFLASFPIVKILAKVGVSDLTTFMVSTPPLILAWYYLVSLLGAHLISRSRRAKLLTSH